MVKHLAVDDNQFKSLDSLSISLVPVIQDHRCRFWGYVLARALNLIGKVHAAVQDTGNKYGFAFLKVNHNMLFAVESPVYWRNIGVTFSGLTH